MNREILDPILDRMFEDYPDAYPFDDEDHFTMVLVDHPDGKLTTSVIFRVSCRSIRLGLELVIGSDYGGLYSHRVLANEMAKQARNCEQFYGSRVTEGDSDEHDYKIVHFLCRPISFRTLTIEHVYDLLSKLPEVLKNAEIALGGIVWKDRYDEDEQLFSREIVYPLLMKMGFTHVKFCHGNGEYGKDFIFAETTPFGHLRYYGLQVKAGDIKGKLNSSIDTLIGQLKDAFSMPFHELGSDNKQHISAFIIAISGHFTENAKAKIAAKTPKELVGSIYFLDRDAIDELIHKYWETK